MAVAHGVALGEGLRGPMEGCWIDDPLGLVAHIVAHIVAGDVIGVRPIVAYAGGVRADLVNAPHPASAMSQAESV